MLFLESRDSSSQATLIPSMPVAGHITLSPVTLFVLCFTYEQKSWLLMSFINLWRFFWYEELILTSLLVTVGHHMLFIWFCTNIQAWISHSFILYVSQQQLQTDALCTVYAALSKMIFKIKSTVPFLLSLKTSPQHLLICAGYHSSPSSPRFACDILFLNHWGDF